MYKDDCRVVPHWPRSNLPSRPREVSAGLIAILFYWNTETFVRRVSDGPDLPDQNHIDLEPTRSSYGNIVITRTVVQAACFGKLLGRKRCIFVIDTINYIVDKSLDNTRW